MRSEPAESKRIILTTVGSLGDLHPYLAIALELKSRGHQPVIGTSEMYRNKCEALGIEFHPVRPHLLESDNADAADLIAKAMDARDGPEYLLRELLIPAVRGAYEDLSLVVADADLLVTHPITFAGPLIAQVTNIPWVATVLAPYSLWSNHQPPVLSTAPWLYPVLKFGGPAVSRVFRKLIDTVTTPWVQPLYDFRQELGLPRGLHPVFEGQHSAHLNLALFSKVLCEPQPDWPMNTQVSGFCFYDKKDNAPVYPELLNFLDAGEPPIVFTLGSAVVHIAGDFFRESIKAAMLLNRRAVLLVGDDAYTPHNLPEGIVAFDYAPYSDLFPRAACIVHQGGVGTTGQAIRAGIPTLIVPFSTDQPDNAARTVRIGTGRTLTRSKYKAARIAQELKLLLETPAYAETAKAVGRQVRAEHGVQTAVDLMLDAI